MGLKNKGIIRNSQKYQKHYEVLSSVSLLISRSGKNRKTEVLQGKISIKKRPHVTRNCVLHKVV